MKICIWMNMPSHHQSAFFRVLSERKDIDLQVRYYEKVPEVRKKLGWKDGKELGLNQTYIDSVNTIESSIPDWKERIHIIPGFSSPFLKELIDFTILNNLKWIHWSERSGIGLAKSLHYNYSLINLLTPLFLKAKGYKEYANKINEYALGAFAIGELAKKDFIKWGVNEKKIRFLPYSLDPLSKTIGIENLLKTDERLFMYVGALSKRKGIHELLLAFQKSISKFPKWKLALIGDDRSNGLYKKQVKDLNIEENVIFTGVVPSNQINNYMEQADVFVLPTLFDGWGAVLNEAASLGKALISTDQAGAAYHLIKNGENGFMVKAKNIDELSNAMQYYMEHPEAINNYGQKSLELFKYYTPKKSAELFVSNIYDLLKQKK